MRERLVADRGLRHHGLDEAGAVADLQKVDLAARSAVGQPAFDGDGLAVVLGDVFDVDVHALASNSAPNSNGSAKSSSIA